jgi:dihydrofolate reductase
MTLSCIVAVSDNGVIGKDNDLPWRLPEDLKRFKRLTMGHPIIMGRKTYDSIGRPLPGRTSIVLTRDPDCAPTGTVVVHSLEDAIAACAGEEEAFVIGGASLFTEALPLCDRLYLTRVHGEIEGDVLFSIANLDAWTLLEEEQHEADEKHRHPYTFQVYERTGL